MNEWVDGTATNTKRAEKEKKIDASAKRLDMKFKKWKQCKLTPTEMKKMQRVLGPWCKQHNLPSMYTLEDCGILHSNANCPMQHFHCDAAEVNMLIVFPTSPTYPTSTILPSFVAPFFRLSLIPILMKALPSLL